MKIRLLQTIKGKGTLWLKDSILDSSKEPFHTDIQGYLGNPYIVEVLVPDSPLPAEQQEEEKKEEAKDEEIRKEVTEEDGKGQEQETEGTAEAKTAIASKKEKEVKVPKLNKRSKK